jgi:signal transduction histidine kinase
MVSSSGMGLMSIDQRIKVVGGKYIIEREIGKGFGFYLDFPLDFEIK